MASHHQLLSMIPLFLLLLPSAFSITLFLPIFRTTDRVQPQYHARLEIGTPPVPIALTLDVNYVYTWLTCDSVGYNRSSTYSTVLCHSPDCKSYSLDNVCFDTCNDTSVPTPACNPNQCGSGPINPITDVLDLGRVVLDTATLSRRDSPSSSELLPRLPLSCVDASSAILRGLSRSSNGILSFSMAPIGIQYHVSAAFPVPRKFSVCLPSSSASDGTVYFGGGPYSDTKVTKSMVSLPLVVNSNNTGAFHQEDASVHYYVKLTAIEIDGTPVVFNSSFLSFDVNGDGGALVSPIISYGQLRSEIYRPFVDLYVARAKARNVKTVTPPRKEFGACFDPNSIRYDPKTGSGLPVVDLVSEGKRRWRILGSNSVVEVRGASCLAFVEGKPLRPKQLPEVFPAVVIGGVQMEDNLVEFDAENARLGVTSSLLRLGTSCPKLREIID